MDVYTYTYTYIHREREREEHALAVDELGDLGKDVRFVHTDSLEHVQGRLSKRKNK
jgi:hypothetical protein